jgi:alkylation response protein AidB-like acyl-CoA dehydrogenase
MAVHLTEALVELVRGDTELGARLRTSALVHDVLGELWTDGDLCRLMTMRSMSIVERGAKFTYEASAEKVFAPEYAVRSTEKISQLLGAYAQLLSDSENAVNQGLFAHNLLGAYQAGINHGSVQVMRDQVAKRGLNLPRR